MQFIAGLMVGGGVTLILMCCLIVGSKSEGHRPKNSLKESEDVFTIS